MATNPTSPDPDSSSYQPIPDDEWLPQSAIEAMSMERELRPEETAHDRSKRIFEENADRAASAIVHLAIHSQNERVRLDAAKYTVERLLGKVGDEKGTDESGPIADFIREVESHMAKAATSSGNTSTDSTNPNQEGA